MDHTATHRPRVSRETKRLLITAFIALAALWVLAGIRFPDRPAAPNPVQPLLTPLAPPPRFDDLAAEVADLEIRLRPLLTRFSGRMYREPETALRVGEDFAVVLLSEDPAFRDTVLHGPVVSFDAASGLALVRVPAFRVSPPVIWTPNDVSRPRYLLATDISAGVPSLRPVFISVLATTTVPLWRETVWMAPSSSDLVPGSFVFTPDARLAGLVADHNGRTFIVPGATLMTAIDRLLQKDE